MQECFSHYESDRRCSERVSDDSVLLVSDYFDNSILFAAPAVVEDISPEGISFRVNTSVERDQILDLVICSNQIQGLSFRVKALGHF